MRKLPAQCPPSSIETTKIFPAPPAPALRFVTFLFFVFYNNHLSFSLPMSLKWNKQPLCYLQINYPLNLVSQSFHIGLGARFTSAIYSSIFEDFAHMAFTCSELFLLIYFFLCKQQCHELFFVHGYPDSNTNTNTSKGICQEFLFSRKHPRLPLHHLGLFGIEPVRLPEQSAHLVIITRKILIMTITRMITLGITMMI